MVSKIQWLICLLTIFIAIGCSQGGENPASQKTSDASQQSAPAPAASNIPEEGVPPSAKGSAAGIEWTIPAAWQSQSSRPMRVATYTIPKPTGAPEDGECAVFFFGSGQGGDVRSNIDRWISQFETNEKPEESKRTVHGIQVTVVRISGNYLSPGGPMMQSQGTKPDYRLIGAIVEAPQGSVFFKATGPSKTIAAAESDFTELVDSIKTQPI